MLYKLFSQNVNAQGLIDTAAVMSVQQINAITQECRTNNTDINRDPTSGDEEIVLPSDAVIQQCVEATFACAQEGYSSFSPSVDSDTNQCTCTVTQAQIDQADQTEWSDITAGDIPCADLPVEIDQIPDASSAEECAFGIQTDLEGAPLLDADGNTSCVANNYGTLGISCSPEQLQRGECTLNVSQLLGVREEQGGNNTIMTRAQDAILAGTSFIGVVMTVAIIVIGFRYLWAGANRGQAADARKALVYTLLGFVLVVFSVVIIRLVQYLIAG